MLVNLSLCMIVKNEELSLPQCLESVKDVVEEMVILDTGSTDNTIKVAQDFGAKVESFSWCDDFAAARNQALSYVEGEWVLVLDADEVLTREIIPSIQQAIANPHHLVINLVRQEVGASQSPYSLISRLFRRHPEIKFTRPYHAIIDDSVSKLQEKETQWQVVNLPSVGILHYGYQPGTIAAKDKASRAQKSMERYLATNPNDPYVCSKLGALYVNIGRLEEGLRLLERGLQNSDGNEAPLLFELNYHLGNVYTRRQNPNQAAIHYQQALQQPILPQLKLGAYNNLGGLLKAVGQLPMAKKAFDQALKIDPNFAIAYYNLGMTLKAMGLFTEAIAAYQKAITLIPDYPWAYQNLGVTLLKIGKVTESLEAFQKAIALHESQNPQEAKQLRQGLEEMGLY